MATKHKRANTECAVRDRGEVENIFSLVVLNLQAIWCGPNASNFVYDSIRSFILLVLQLKTSSLMIREDGLFFFFFWFNDWRFFPLSPIEISFGIYWISDIDRYNIHILGICEILKSRKSLDVLPPSTRIYHRHYEMCVRENECAAQCVLELQLSVSPFLFGVTAIREKETSWYMHFTFMHILSVICIWFLYFTLITFFSIG